jgi:hypothetical protein
LVFGVGRLAPQRPSVIRSFSPNHDAPAAGQNSNAQLQTPNSKIAPFLACVARFAHRNFDSSLGARDAVSCKLCPL